MLHSHVLRVLVGLVAFAPLSAAGILTVGPAGSGAQFTEIQAAIDAALDDDVILVNPGTYQHVLVNKPLRILGDGTGLVRIEGPEFGARILGIGAGRELVLSGAEVRETTESYDVVSLQDCAGTIVLSDVSVPGGDFSWNGVRVQNCARVVLLDSQASGAGGFGALSALDSEVWLANATIHGKSKIFDGGAPGIQLENSTLHAWRSRIFGGDAIVLSPKFGGPGGEGVLLLNSRADLFGGPDSEVRGGRGGYDPAIAFSYHGGAGMSLFQASRARLQAGIPIHGGLDGLGLAQAPATAVDRTSSFTFDPRVFPTLAASARQVQLGSSFGVTLTGNPGGFQVLYLSLRTGPTKVYRGVDGFGLLVLDRAQLFSLAGEVLGASGSATVNLRVPSTSSLLGAPLFLQAAEAFGGSFAIANPELVTITR